MNQFEYTPPKNRPITSEELLADLQKVADKLGTNILTQKLYTEYGKFDVTTLSKRFGTWNNALARLKLKSGNICNYSDEELFENILNIWQHKGKQPVRNDLSLPPSTISQTPYKRRFNSWAHALQSFIEFANQSDIQTITKNTQNANNSQRSNRIPSLRLRFHVLKRDGFACTKCGASPAKNRSVELHVDHIKPWSKGGNTVIDNLQTLCQKCNIGKSDIE